jgi:DNA-binding NarL/FixJ family response regulator
MRVLIVGPADARERLRAGLHESIEVVAEFASVSAARESGATADAIVIAAPNGAGREKDRVADLKTEGDPNRVDLHESLTHREQQVLELLAEGLPNKAIAAQLGISDQTVKFHVASISAKLGATNRTEAVRIALRRGLLTL